MSSVPLEGNDLNFPENQQQQQQLSTRKRVSVQTIPSLAELLSKRNMKREQVKCACGNRIFRNFIFV